MGEIPEKKGEALSYILSIYSSVGGTRMVLSKRCEVKPS